MLHVDVFHIYAHHYNPEGIIGYEHPLRGPEEKELTGSQNRCEDSMSHLHNVTNDTRQNGNQCNCSLKCPIPPQSQAVLNEGHQAEYNLAYVSKSFHPSYTWLDCR